MDTPETATVEITQADRKRLAAYYCHPLVNNPSMAEAVLADDWLSGASDAEIAMLETLARRRTRATRQDGLREALRNGLSLIDDMSRFVGQMALKDYALFNEAPMQMRQQLAALSASPEGEG